MTREEIIEECKQRLGQHEKDFYNAIIKALEQQPCDDKVRITFDKGTLKHSGNGYVTYNKDWFRKHFADEVAIMTGYDGYIEQQPSSDCVSRADVLKRIKEWRDCEFVKMTNPYHYLEKRIQSMPPVTPTRKSGLRWIERFDNEDKWLECPHCHKDSDNAYAYCPNCGADMRGNENDC